jgi:23S rRNA maturation mini-RNase III
MKASSNFLGNQLEKMGNSQSETSASNHSNIISNTRASKEIEELIGTLLLRGKFKTFQEFIDAHSKSSFL